MFWIFIKQWLGYTTRTINVHPQLYFELLQWYSYSGYFQLSKCKVIWDSCQTSLGLRISRGEHSGAYVKEHKAADDLSGSAFDCYGGMHTPLLPEAQFWHEWNVGLLLHLHLKSGSLSLCHPPKCSCTLFVCLVRQPKWMELLCCFFSKCVEIDTESKLKMLGKMPDDSWCR